MKPIKTIHDPRISTFIEQARNFKFLPHRGGTMRVSAAALRQLTQPLSHQLTQTVTKKPDPATSILIQVACEHERAKAEKTQIKAMIGTAITTAAIVGSLVAYYFAKDKQVMTQRTDPVSPRATWTARP